MRKSEMINFSKSFFVKEPKSQVKTDELQTAGSGSDKTAYAEKVAQQGLTFSQMYQMYYADPWIRACVDRIVDRTVDIQPLIKYVSMKEKPTDEQKRESERATNLITKPNSNGESFSSLRKKITRDTLVYDASCLELARGKSIGGKENNSVELFAVSGDSVKINVDKNGMLKDKAFIQVNQELTEVAAWSAEEMLYFIANPVAGKVYGVSPLESLVQTVTAELYTAQHNLDFFYNNATPRFAVLIEGLGTGQGDAALRRFKTWWDRELKGQPHRPIMIGTEGGNIRLEKLGLTNNEMQFKEYSMFLLMKIMSVYRM
ncbi:MAG: phage portal protein, partial [Candidatus Hodarchaeales archaeon]